jgi:hypothetical protein
LTKPDTISGSNRSCDKHQFFQLVKVALILDLRSSQGLQYGNVTQKFPQSLGLLLFYFLVSIGLAVAAYVIPSAFTSILMVTSMVMAFVAVNVLIEFGAIILSPDDFQILSPLPISSKTIFYAKTTNLLIYSWAVTTSLALLPTISLAAKFGTPGVPVLFYLSQVFAGCSVAMFIAFVYAGMLKVVSAEKLSSILSYVQMLLGFVVWFGYMIVSRTLGAKLATLGDLTEWWIFAFPPAWYASFTGLAGIISGTNWIWSLCVGIIGTLTAFMAGSKYLSSGYQSSISKASVAQPAHKVRAAGKRKRDVGWLSGWFRPEDLSIGKLIWAHFKYDNRFKMTILSLVPLSAIYIFLAASEGIADPFVNKVHGGDGVMIFIPAALLPVMIASSLVYSSSHKASWIFFATPAKLTDVIFAGLRFVHFAFVIPYTILYAVALGFIYGSFSHSILLCLIIYLLIMTQLRIAFAFMGNVPFSLPPKKGQQGSIFGLLIILLPVTIVVMLAFTSLLTESDTVIVYFSGVAILLLTTAISHWICKRRIAIKASRLRYTG